MSLIPAEDGARPSYDEFRVLEERVEKVRDGLISQIDMGHHFRERFRGQIDALDRRIERVEQGLFSIGARFEDIIGSVERRFERVNDALDVVLARFDAFDQQQDGLRTHITRVMLLGMGAIALVTLVMLSGALTLLR